MDRGEKQRAREGKREGQREGGREGQTDREIKINNWGDFLDNHDYSVH